MDKRFGFPKYTIQLFTVGSIMCFTGCLFGVTLDKLMYSMANEKILYFGAILFQVSTIVFSIMWQKYENKMIKRIQSFQMVYIIFTITELIICIYSVINGGKFGSFQKLIDICLVKYEDYSLVDRFVAFDLLVYENVLFGSFIYSFLVNGEKTVLARLYPGDLRSRYDRISETVYSISRISGMAFGGFILPIETKNESLIYYVIFVNIMCLFNKFLEMKQYSYYKQVINGEIKYEDFEPD